MIRLRAARFAGQVRLAFARLTRSTAAACAALAMLAGFVACTLADDVAHAAPALRRIIQSAPIYLPQSRAYFAQITAQHGTPPTLRWKKGVNTLVGCLIANGSWGDYGALYDFGAADAVTASINLVNPGTYTLADLGTILAFKPYIGFTGNGGSLFLGASPYTNLQSLANFSQNSGHIEVWTYSSGASGAYDIGNQGGLQTSLNSQTGAFRINSATSSTSNLTGTGYFWADRTSSSTQNAGRNASGASGNPFSATSTTVQNALATILQSNGSFSSDQLSMAGIGSGQGVTMSEGNYACWNTFLQNGSGAAH